MHLGKKNISSLLWSPRAQPGLYFLRFREVQAKFSPKIEDNLVKIRGHFTEKDLGNSINLHTFHLFSSESVVRDYKNEEYGIQRSRTHDFGKEGPPLPPLPVPLLATHEVKQNISNKATVGCRFAWLAFISRNNLGNDEFIDRLGFIVDFIKVL